MPDDVLDLLARSDREALERLAVEGRTAAAELAAMLLEDQLRWLRGARHTRSGAGLTAVVRRSGTGRRR